MFCSNCGSRVSDHALFCQQCGAKLTPQPAPIAAQPIPLPYGIELVNGNTLHWFFVQDLKKDRRVPKILEIVFAAVTFFISLIIFFENLYRGFAEAFVFAVEIFLISFAICSVLTLVSWLILVGLKGGKNRLEFFMNDTQVMYMDTMQSFVSCFSDVKSIKTHRKIHMIGVNSTFKKNTIYASPEQYDFVLNYIVSRCPQAVQKID